MIQVKHGKPSKSISAKPLLELPHLIGNDLIVTEFRKTPNRWRVWLIGKRPARTGLRAGLLALGAYVVFTYLYLPMFVRGDSMMPTYTDGAFRFANAWHYRWNDPDVGDVVVIALAGRRTMFMKRVLAGPGDTVFFREGQLVVNDIDVEEPYVVIAGTWSTPSEELGTDEFFVAGDNRSGPLEGHVMGVVERNRIVGKLTR